MSNVVPVRPAEAAGRRGCGALTDLHLAAILHRSYAQDLPAMRDHENRLFSSRGDLRTTSNVWVGGLFFGVRKELGRKNTAVASE